MRALRRALSGLREHPLLAVATASAVAVVLTLAGAFALVVGNLSGVLDRWGKDVQISCYLSPGVDDERLFALKAEIEAMPEVAGVEYVSSDEALELFADAIEGMDRLLADLDENPLPASLEVRLGAEHQRPDQVQAIAQRLRRPEFADLDWSREWVERFHTFVALLRLSTLVLGVLLVAAGVFIVNNTVRLALHARRDELTIIGMVGGTRWFAWLPLLIEGTILGFLGGAFALALLWILHRWAYLELQASLGLLGPELLAFLAPGAMGALLAAGTVIGLLGAATSLIRTKLEVA